METAMGDVRSWKRCCAPAWPQPPPVARRDLAAARLVSRLPYGVLCVRSGRITSRFCRSIETKGLSYADRDAVVARLAEVAQRELSVRSA